MAGEALVNSWNEWDPLEEIVVGSADAACFEPTEPGCKPQVRGAPPGHNQPFPSGPKSERAIELANAELAGLVSLLEAKGVKVHRPQPYDFSRSLDTGAFKVSNQYCAVCPRDVLITLGNEILEATMSRRARFFEYLPYRSVIYDLWSRDPDMQWVCAPKPTMSDEMYNEDFWRWPLHTRYQRMHDFEFCVKQEEVIFDAADISRFGRDVFIQESMTTNRAGIAWLRRHLAPKGFRVHTVHFPLDLFPSHIDCTFVPLRPGLVLTNPERPIKEEEKRLFLDSGWDFLEAPQPTSSNDEMPAYCQSSKWLSMNVLSLGPDMVVCEQCENPLHELLYKRGFEVLTLPFRNVFEYGGSIHCATWDIRRRGGCEDYFPALADSAVN